MIAAPTSSQSSTRTVWKYAMPFGSGPDTFSIEMPAGADVLTVHVQNGAPQIWALCDPTAPDETRHFRIAGTGHPIGEDIKGYVGTFMVAGGSLVFHVFEVVL
jgi:hypothetical protein